MGGGDVASVGVGGGGRVYKVDYDSFKVFQSVNEQEPKQRQKADQNMVRVA